MNHLAHALLSGPDDALRLGGMMGDFVRGAIDPALPRGIRQGIALHRAIDTFTDGHDVIRELRAYFEPPYRRYAGILIDIWFDHLLARDFRHWTPAPLKDFSEDLQRLLEENDALLPESLSRFAHYMRARGLPAAYASREVIGEVLAGVGSRLKRDSPLAQGLLEISRLERELAEAFSGFFPQLVDFATGWRREASSPGSN